MPGEPFPEIRAALEHATTGADNWVYRMPLAVERLDEDPQVAADTAELRTLIDASRRLRTIP